MKRTITIEGNKGNIAKLEAMLAVFDLKIVDLEAETPMAQPKAEAKKPAKKTSKKSSDNFDRALYESIAKELGCYGKHGCYKACRSTVYKVMDGTLTKAKAKKEVEAWKKTTSWAK